MNGKAFVILSFIMIAGNCLADPQTYLVIKLRMNPTEDFSQRTNENFESYYYELAAFAEADATVYFQDRKDIDKDLIGHVGKAHGFKHHLIGDSADIYASFFCRALDALLTDTPK
jgi:hypothetical protein